MLITKTQAADRLQISRRTLERIIEDGGLPSVKVGGQVRINPDALELYIKRNQRGNPMQTRPIDLAQLDGRRIVEDDHAFQIASRHLVEAEQELREAQDRLTHLRRMDAQHKDLAVTVEFERLFGRDRDALEAAITEAERDVTLCEIERLECAADVDAARRNALRPYVEPIEAELVALRERLRLVNKAAEAIIQPYRAPGGGERLRAAALRADLARKRAA